MNNIAYWLLIGSITSGTILNHMVRTIICLKLLFLLKTVVVITRIMQWSPLWTWSRRDDYLVQLLCIYISRSTQIITVTAHLTGLRCCTGIKMSLILRRAVKVWISEIMLKLFKLSMKTSLTWNHSWIISMTDLTLKLLTSIMSYMWKRFGIHEFHG